MNIWELEPNELNFEYQGINCSVRRRPEGHLVAYVILDEKHLLHGVDFDDLNCSLSEYKREITYSDYEGSNWLIGISFAHSGDYIPEIDGKELPEELNKLDNFAKTFFADLKVEVTPSDYKGIEFAISELKLLVDNLITLKEIKKFEY